MAGHVYKKLELVGSSPKGIDDAIQQAVTKASKTLRNVHWFEMVDVRGQVEDGKVAHWQVTLKIGFTLDE